MYVKGEEDYICMAQWAAELSTEVYRYETVNKKTKGEHIVMTI